MTERSRSIGGMKAKKRGDAFENLLRGEAQRTRWVIVSIPTGCKVLGKNRFIRVATPFDFVFVKSGYILFADAKTTIGKTFSKSMITKHQVDHLLQIHNEMICAGYIVNFTTLNTTVFFDALTLDSLKAGESLTPNQGIHMGNNSIILLSRVFKEQDVPSLVLSQ